MNQIPLHNRVKKTLKEWHSDGVSENDCLACSSGCCSHGRFAILENIILIYEKYINGDLVLEDYQFIPNLSFSDFVWKYFDIYSYSTGSRFFKKSIVIFHMKSLTEDNQLISIPEGGSY